MRSLTQRLVRCIAKINDRNEATRRSGLAREVAEYQTPCSRASPLLQVELQYFAGPLSGFSVFSASLR